jgi:hypothetical protein
MGEVNCRTTLSTPLSVAVVPINPNICHQRYQNSSTLSAAVPLDFTFNRLFTVLIQNVNSYFLRNRKVTTTPLRSVAKSDSES